jgi:hypothetical protein
MPRMGSRTRVSKVLAGAPVIDTWTAGADRAQWNWKPPQAGGTGQNVTVLHPVPQLVPINPHPRKCSQQHRAYALTLRCTAVCQPQPRLLDLAHSPQVHLNGAAFSDAR